jgi:dipeptidyl aminopeptidase/acylaminoacyl peptidase
MKKAQLLIIPLCFWVILLNAQQIVQKSVLDTAILGRWPKLSDQTPVISPKGNYVAYSVDEKIPERRIFTIKNIKTGWQKTYTEVTSLIRFFGDDSEAVLLKGDTLHFIALGKNNPDRVVITKLAFQGNNDQQSQWLIYIDRSCQLKSINLSTKQEVKVGEAISFKLNARTQRLFYTDTLPSDKGTIAHLYMFNLQNAERTDIWSGLPGEDALIAKFSGDGQKTAFLTSDKRQPGNTRSLWIYQLGQAKAHQLVREDDLRFTNGFHFASPYEFSKDGKWLFFSLVRNNYQDASKSSPLGVAVDVWSYKDKLLQPQQLDKRIDHSEKHEAAISSDSRQLWVLKRDESWALPPQMFPSDKVVVVHQATRGLVDPFGFYTFPRSHSIFALNNGERKGLNAFSKNHAFLSGISPDGEWLIFYDDKLERYLSYGLSTHTIANLTKGLSTSFNEDYSVNKHKSPVEGIAGWIAEKTKVLIYDNYDLWALDPSGHERPVNITNGYGLSHHVKLRIITDPNINGLQTYHFNDTLIFTGFSTENKKNGFFRVVLGKKEQPVMLTMGDYHYYISGSQIPGAGDEYDDSKVFVKASYADVWVVKRQSAKEAPNYFYTTDLRSFKPITNIAPQLNYNWLSTQLITYKQLDGTKCQGILYKPENFDPSKKYPVIFNYYQILSSRLNEFAYPAFTTEAINIPWFVSHGYLVFTPDIYFQFASISNKTVGQYSYNSVVAAAKYLAQLPFVDKTHLGIQGHSFGARQTNYLVSHTNLFAAASEMAGESDQVSDYLALLLQASTQDESGEQQQPYHEISQGMMGATLWQRPDLYLRESIVLKANQIRTPLLIIHNKNDMSVPWRQGVELYMALRRLKKPSWMLQYDNGNHTLDGNIPEARDYTIRLTQFFDHYLKGYPPPAWMTRGVPAKMKGIETRYELDPKGECGPDCRICKKKDYKSFDPKLAVVSQMVTQ